jgi:hypothetical protein
MILESRRRREITNIIGVAGSTSPALSVLEIPVIILVMTRRGGIFVVIGVVGTR